jgi:hypothetical protein
MLELGFGLVRKQGGIRVPGAPKRVRFLLFFPHHQILSM